MKRTLKPFLIAVAVALVLGADAKLSSAATATGSLTLTATVGASCTITSQTISAFPYDPVVTNKTTDLTNGTNSVQYTCTSGTTPTSIDLGQGANACTAVAGFCTAISTATAPARQMISGANKLAYNLFSSNANLTTGTPAVAWGTGSNGPAMVAGIGSQQTFVLFVRIPANQQVPAASNYTDTVAETINF